MKVRLTTRDSFLVLLKEARNDGDLARLQREREVLSRLRMAGITRILSDELETEVPALAFHFVGHHSFATFRTPRERDILQLFQECAHLLTRLHARGIAHGGISLDHFLLDRFSHPVLCSFSRASELDATRSLAKADVASLLAVMQSVLAAAPSSDPAWAKRLRGGKQRLSHQLLLVVRAASESRISSAADLAAQLSELAISYGLSPSSTEQLRPASPFFEDRSVL